ncbi:MAG TPA: hypothetical protein PLS56_02660, partial [Candidatus Dojkabacteria bacterium]|nr:hypothetical protein [Candidatus Dojkabacteria bacterium]
MPKVLILKEGRSFTPSKVKNPPSMRILDDTTVEFVGPSHSQGGIKTEIQGQKVEVEGKETMYSATDGSINIMGNMTNPLTGRKFKQDSKILAKKEQKMNKLMDYANPLMNTYSPFDKWDSLKFNSGYAMAVGANSKKQELNASKEHLADMQNAMLEMADEMDVDPQSFSKGIMKARKGTKIPIYQNGGKSRRPRGANPNSWEYRDGQWYRKEPTKP